MRRLLNWALIRALRSRQLLNIWVVLYVSIQCWALLLLLHEGVVTVILLWRLRRILIDCRVI